MIVTTCLSIALFVFSVYMIIVNSDLHSQIDEKAAKIESLLDDVTHLAAQLRDIQEENKGLINCVGILDKNLVAQLSYNKTLETEIPQRDSKGRFKHK